MPDTGRTISWTENLQLTCPSDFLVTPRPRCQHHDTETGKRHATPQLVTGDYYTGQFRAPSEATVPKILRDGQKFEGAGLEVRDRCSSSPLLVRKKQTLARPASHHTESNTQYSTQSRWIVTGFSLEAASPLTKFDAGREFSLTLHTDSEFAHGEKSRPMEKRLSSDGASRKAEPLISIFASQRSQVFTSHGASPQISLRMYRKSLSSHRAL